MLKSQYREWSSQGHQNGQDKEELKQFWQITLPLKEESCHLSDQLQKVSE